MKARDLKNGQHESVDPLSISDVEDARQLISALLENGVDAQIAVDANGTIKFVSSRIEDIFGYSQAELLGEPVEHLIPEAARGNHSHYVRGFFERSTARLMGNGMEFSGLRADGSLIPVEIGLNRIQINGAKLVLCSIRDISQRKLIQKELRLSESRSDEVQRIAKIGNWDWNIVEDELWWSDEIYRIFGSEPQEFECTYEAFLKHVHPDDRDLVNEAVGRAIEQRKPYSIRHRIVMKDGTERVVDEKADLTVDSDGRVSRMIGTVQDVTDYQKIEEEVYRSEARLKEAEQVAKIGSWEWDVANGGQHWSDGLYSILGEDPATLEASFESFLSRVHPDDRRDLVIRNHDVLDVCDDMTPLELRIVLRDGSEKVIVRRTFVRRDKKNRPVTVIGTVQDITERKRAEARIEYLASHDELTGLPNRATFRQLLTRAIETAKRYEHKGAVLFIDLDSFKYINDSLGHAAGDELLCVIGARLKRALRQSDCAARLGGDEFCILAEDIGDECGASALAEKCLKTISEPVVVAGRELQPRASIGITLFPDDAQDSHTLIKAADTAMYAAKHDSKSRYQFYTHELTIKAEHRMALEHDLRRSLSRGEFVLYYQPQVELVSGRMRSMEALIRWEHPQRGLVGPTEFIDIAERTGLIEMLGEWVLNRACRDAMAMNAGRTGPMRIAVNISGKHFMDGRIVKSVESALEKTGLDPDLLEIEVTESVIQATDRTIETFHRLRDLGVHIAIDDFGTGYSCLDSLRSLPIDTLKVDQRFVRDLLKSPEIPAIIGTIVAMARAMHLQVVVEGVETLEHVQYLCGLGCELAQGFYFSKPLSADRVVELVDHDFLPNRTSDPKSALPAGYA